MDSASEKPKGLRGIAALYDDKERKDLFRKYLYLLGWVELAILLTCWLYQIGDSGHDGESVFPWRLYFVIAFLAPVAVTFLLGIAVVGFNKYFAEPSNPWRADRKAKPQGAPQEARSSSWTAWLRGSASSVSGSFVAARLLRGIFLQTGCHCNDYRQRG